MLDTPGWTESRVERLKKLWAEGVSATDISAQLGGVSRSAVLGKVHRLKLRRSPQGNVEASAANRKRKTASHVARAPKTHTTYQRAIARREDLAKVEVLEVEEDLPDVTHLIGVTELTERTCKWPVGTPGDEGFGFCGAEKKRGAGPYCELHTKRARRGE